MGNSSIARGGGGVHWLALPMQLAKEVRTWSRPATVGSQPSPPRPTTPLHPERRRLPRRRCHLPPGLRWTRGARLRAVGRGTRFLPTSTGFRALTRSADSTTEAWTSASGDACTRSAEPLPWAPLTVLDAQSNGARVVAAVGTHASLHEVWFSDDGVAWRQATLARESPALIASRGDAVFTQVRRGLDDVPCRRPGAPALLRHGSDAGSVRRRARLAHAGRVLLHGRGSRGIRAGVIRRRRVDLGRRPEVGQPPCTRHPPAGHRSRRDLRAC